MCGTLLWCGLLIILRGAGISRVVRRVTDQDMLRIVRREDKLLCECEVLLEDFEESLRLRLANW